MIHVKTLLAAASAVLIIGLAAPALAPASALQETSTCIVHTPLNRSCGFIAAGKDGFVQATGAWYIELDDGSHTVTASGPGGALPVSITNFVTGTHYAIVLDGVDAVAIVNTDKVCAAGVGGCLGQGCRTSGVGVCVSSASVGSDSEVSFASNELWVQVDGMPTCKVGVPSGQTSNCP